MINASNQPKVEAYVLSLLAEGRYQAAFRAIDELGAAHLYAPDLNNHALQLMESGQSQLAEELFRKAISFDPALASAHCGLGVLYLRQSKPDRAIASLQQALALNPDSAGARIALGLALCHLGRLAEAAPQLIAALELAPGQPNALEALRELRTALSRSANPKKSAGQLPPRERAELLTRIDRALQQNATPRTGENARPTISVCMIVKNEEQALPRCLRSIRKCADEIVVVDTGSTDRTVAIAQEFGAKPGYFEWCNDFAAARNYALGLAGGDWIFIMDADDEMCPGGDAALRIFVDNRPAAEVCSLRTRIPTVGGMETFIEHPRLYRNRLGLHYANGVHEQLVYSDGSPALPQLATGISVYHHGYINGDESMGVRHQRNLQILCAEVAHKPNDPVPHFFMGKEYRSQRKFTEALPWLRRAVELLADQPAGCMRMKAYSYLAEALLVVGRPQEALPVAEEALALYPDNPEILFGLGEIKLALQREQEAIAAYQAATRGRFGGKLANQDFLCRDLKPLLRLAEIALAQDDLQQAEGHWRKAQALRGDHELLTRLQVRIEAAKAQQRAAHEAEAKLADYRIQLEVLPDDLRTRSELVARLIELKRLEEAEAVAAAAPQLAEDSPEALNLHGAALAAAGRLLQAEQAFARAVACEPDNSALLCNLGAVQHQLGRFAEARATFAAALTADPDCSFARLGLGELCLDQQHWDEALEHFEAAAKAESTQVSAWLGLARAYLEKRAFQAAVMCYEKAVKLSEHAPEVLAELAQVRNRLLALRQPAPGGA